MRPEEVAVIEEWMRIARRELHFAQAQSDAEEIWATRCFLAQQAAEKSLKASLLYFGVDFPWTHNLVILIGLLPPSANPPADVRQAALLTRYAVATRYPRFYETVTQEDYNTAIRLATAVVTWAESVLACVTKFNTFDDFWEELLRRLQPGIDIEGWSVTKDHTGKVYKVVSVAPGSITLSGGKLKGTRTISKSEFEKSFPYLRRYCDGTEPRELLRDLSWNSAYVISIFHWLENK